MRVFFGNIAAVNGQHPDHGNIERDDDRRPGRIPLQPCETHNGTYHGKSYADTSCPGSTAKEAEPCENNDDAGDEVNPSPRGCIEFEYIFLVENVDFVVE